jgi:V/A-type H+-transporting ATPase subunit I
MIVAMKKAAIIVRQQDVGTALEDLRDLGVLHVEHQKMPQGRSLESLREEEAILREALNILSISGAGKPGAGRSLAPEGQAAARHIVDLYKRLEHLKDYASSLQGAISAWEPWGDFDPSAFTSLASQGIRVSLFYAPAHELEGLPAEAAVEIIRRNRGMVYGMVVARQNITLPFKETALPKMSLSKMRVRLARDQERIAYLEELLRKASVYKESLIQALRSYETSLPFEEARQGMGQEGELAYIAGFIPHDAQNGLLSAAKRHAWAVSVTDPAPEEISPTLLRNPRWIALISPAMKLLEITPGYTELDISPAFLLFFSLFFGMLIGDAGYGLVYLLLTFWAHRSFGGKIEDKTPFFLFYLLSSCAIVWGLLSGSFFGQAWLVARGFTALVPQLGDVNFVQAFCFSVGAVHLTIAHLWRFAVQWPSLVALAELGWVSIIWACFFLAKNLLLGDPLPWFGKYLIIAGLVLVVFFVNFQKNILKAFASGLGTLALNLVNNFTDVVSYVRLFAVGLAGVAIADAFNFMASGAAAAGIGGMIAAVFILIVGHMLNIVLGPMSVLVHGVRLNVLEFSGHAAVTWSGVPYRPLKK